MSRKTLILCMAVLAAMFLALGIAVAFLYSGTGDKGSRDVSLKGAESCLAAIPSDAVLVGCSSRLDKACRSFLSSFALPDSLYADIERGDLASLRRSPMAVSLHYSGKLIPLYVFDMDGVSETAAEVLQKRVESLGCRTQKNGRFFLVSESEALVKSASRHIDIKVSIVDAPGFAEAIDAVQGDIRIFVPHLQMQKLLSAAGNRTLSRHSPFLERTADWCAFALSSDEQTPFSLEGAFVYDGDTDEFLTVLQDCIPAVSHIADVLPSYTISSVSIPVADIRKYISAYKSFVDSRQRLQDFTARQNKLGGSLGIAPEEFFNALNVKEIAVALFKVDGKMEKVNLIRTGCKDAGLIFKGNEVSSLKGYEPAVHSWAYASFAASVFGELFSMKDESCFTYIDGWIISGSKAAIEDYVIRKSLSYSLDEYVSDAGKEDLLSEQPALVQIYLSLSEDRDEIGACLKPVTIGMIEDAARADYSPVVLRLGRDKNGMTLNADLCNLTLKKSKAPEFERDTTVVVPAGPFKVKNSHTGKMNTFYQNAQNSLCLRDETGKDLWGVPFGKKICGTASNIDYYANGKLQIIFGAGSQVYIIDRLGRYVNGFPLDLGKDILLGPELYDFSGIRKYNILVLHKDNTVEMYNMKGKKPDAWKGISPSETIKSLPEKLIIGGKNFWVVRTSLQTLIYPFYGGDPLTVYEGDDKIRPDSEVKVMDDMSVSVCCYNGKTRIVKLN